MELRKILYRDIEHKESVLSPCEIKNLLRLIDLDIERLNRYKDLPIFFSLVVMSISFVAFGYTFILSNHIQKLDREVFVLQEKLKAVEADLNSPVRQYNF
jgi:hypothetical protein